MLEIRLHCEHCAKSLPANSTEAFICTYECTFCNECVHNILENVCPNCGGNFQPRPIRPQSELIQNPASTGKIIKPVKMQSFAKLRDKVKGISPEQR